VTSAALNALFAELTSFSKSAKPVAPAGLDWEQVVDLAEAHGLAALISYQLDYRFLARLSPPPLVRERLAANFNGAVNDNVLKVTHLRRLLSTEGMPEAVVLGPASWIDGLYPHIAFRQIDDVDVWVRDLSAASIAFAEGGLAVRPLGMGGPVRPLAARLASPDIALSVWRAPAGLRPGTTSTAQTWERKLPVRAYGPVAQRLAPADAVVAHVAALAMEGYAVPRIKLVDLREMVLRLDVESDRGSGFYGPGSPVLRSAEVLERVRGLGLTRALWAGLRLVETLFPEAAPKAKQLALGLPSRAARLVEEAVVQPALNPNRLRVVRAITALRRALLA
jgi:hypothetical protein